MFLIDGKFEIKNRNISLKYRGSSNQRVIDVKETLKEKEIIEIL
ncbi:4Fe-4S cluster-binding domain-containing protein [Clostridium massiliamazoniense]